MSSVANSNLGGPGPLLGQASGGEGPILLGGAGDDRIVLRPGAVALGGDGEDIFVLSRGPGEHLASILDFDWGRDRLDFGALGPAARELDRLQTADGVTRLSVDIDGDGREDGFVLLGSPKLDPAEHPALSEPIVGDVTILPVWPSSDVTTGWDGAQGADVLDPGAHPALEEPTPGDVSILPASDGHNLAGEDPLAGSGDVLDVQQHPALAEPLPGGLPQSFGDGHGVVSAEGFVLGGSPSAFDGWFL